MTVIAERASPPHAHLTWGKRQPRRAETNYGRGQSGMVGTPDDGCPTFGRGASGRVGMPEDGVVTLGRGASGRVGTPLANEIA